MKKRILSFGLALVLCLGLALPAFAAGQTFADVPTSHWAYAQIERAYAEGAITGTSYNEQTGVRLFSPDSPLTVATWVVILTRAFYGSEVDASTATGTWYARNDEVAKAHNLYNMFETVVLDSSCTRAQMAQLIYNVLADKGADLPSRTELQSTKAKIPDINRNSFVYHDAIATCYYLGLLVGTDNAGNVSGSHTLNRAQASVVWSRTKDALAALVDPDKPKTPTPEDGSLKFELQGSENVQNMMNRINAATPAYREGYLTNGEQISDANIQAMLAEMEESMPDGTTWDGQNKYHYFSPQFGGGGGCNSFAYSVSDALFGEDAPMVKHQNFNNIKVGDAIYYRNSANGTGHIIIVTTSPDVDGYFDACDGNNGNKVSWESYGNYKQLAVSPEYSSQTYIYTRYKVNEIGVYTPINAAEVYPEIRCANCNYLMRAAGSRDFDANGGVIHQVCDTCHEFFVCSQCIDCQVYHGHVANCEG